MEYILTMDNIDKSFNGVKVLDKASFHLRKGQVHALVGGNGAGKSTLMKILTGVYLRDAGIVEVDGRKVSFDGYRAASDAGIRMIYQELSIIPTLSVAENIFLNQERTTGKVLLDEKGMLKAAKELLDSFSIDISPKAVVNTLGVGYCQLIEIAKALSKEAKVLVMDEPTASLSESEVVILFDMIHRLKEKGVSIIYISHRMNEILKIADEVTILRDGKNVITAPAGDLDIEAIINHMMGEQTEKAFEWKERQYTGSDETLLEVRGLEVDDWIRDISFSVSKGEVLGFAGLMGSGRTEIVESVFGIRGRCKGEITVDGNRVSIKNVQNAIDAGLALVPEDRRRQGLILMHSVKQNITLPLLNRLKKYFLLDDKKANAVTAESVATFNIKTSGIGKTARLLSGGNQQKIVIAKWLITEPKVLLLDEPTAGVDVGAKGEIINLIRNFADKGNGVVLISSELAELMAVCDRILVLNKGKITGQILREEIKSEEVIQHAIQE
ncbi:MAG TPA: sugar ABC transporter ATP-binding protein [Anaerovoracaceae bacterium]|nr:sugar ABC transporter ATP-binding protein [Anaerovoracaceae bacterium]